MRRPLAAGVATLCLCLLLTPEATPQIGGRSTVEIPPASDRGTWDGTWFYVSRDFNIGLWMRTPEGKDSPEIKVQLMRSLAQEQFETDWNGHADYMARGAPGSFDLTVVNGNPYELTATWDWKLDFVDSGRHEKGNLSLYRTGDGRRLVMLFEDVERHVRRGPNTEVIPLIQVWTFRKASKRQLLWDELPF